MLRSGVRDLGHLPNPVQHFSYAAALNEKGQVVGHADSTEGSLAEGFHNHAFLYGGGGPMRDLIDTSTLDPLFGESAALDVNERGQVVGWAMLRAFLYDSGAVYDLNELLTPSAANWALGTASAINDDGWIVGTGTDPDGHFHGFLLIPTNGPSPIPNPVPLPPAIWSALLAVAATVVGSLICKKASCISR